MDPKKKSVINEILDDPKRLDKIIDKISNMDEDDFDRVQAKIDDKNALEESNIHRITLFFKNDRTGLLVKPIPGMMGWMLNLHEYGSLNFQPNSELKFEISDIASGEFFRFSIKSGGLNYWNDLVDEQQAQDLAKFLGIGISTEC
ncbi:hypothetical protein KI655_18745 [Vibrio sp. D404a]|uniref:hypothetical protein n=1 Tax=unclassified Vibrio TaxID=2614977 RepID=UPI0025578356|nr:MULTISPECIES: hypothetical protein [unclassified Vibrio]MDK9739337.1 hypothetical protein [Vibrio sp. D404a]MDK9797628.1 hypothetical protein [Vibrio sp. D449a]